MQLLPEQIREFYRLWQHWDTHLVNYFEIQVSVHLEVMIPVELFSTELTLYTNQFHVILNLIRKFILFINNCYLHIAFILPNELIRWFLYTNLMLVSIFWQFLQLVKIYKKPKWLHDFYIIQNAWYAFSHCIFKYKKIHLHIVFLVNCLSETLCEDSVLFYWMEQSLHLISISKPMYVWFAML